MFEAFCSSVYSSSGNGMLPAEAVLSKQHSMMAPTIQSRRTHHHLLSSIAIEYDDEAQHHIVTVPSFLPDDDTSFSYPSLLHHIHVLPLLTNDETTHLCELARKYATDNQSWNQQDATRHVSYPTVDFAIEESIDIENYLNQIKFEERIFDKLSTAYDVDVEDMSYLDLFCASYEAKDDTDNMISDSEEDERSTMDRLDYHRDGSLLSFTILLSHPEDFKGGGTIFDALGDVSIDEKCDILQSPGVIQPPHAGYATLHSGKLLHGGHRVSKGQRIVLVGFVDVHERNMKPGILGKATKHWGRNDVSTFYNKRRLSLLKQQNPDEENEQPEWKIKNWRYLVKDTRSYFGKDFKIPLSILDNIERRASLERIRSKRLSTEDMLLREILLPREERGEKIAEQQEEGEWIEVDLDDGIMLDR